MSLPDWARAYGAPLFAARIRTTPEDFQVTEELGFEFAGDGEHDYLWIEKTGTNTEWLARQLAKFADVPARDIGYAGLKDRHAITRQWFSVPRWNSPEWAMMDIEGADLLDVRRHSKKLRRGSHKSNAFRLVMRGNQLEKHAEALAARIAAIRAQGVPNYFGEQRFGRDGANLGLADAWAKGKRLPRHKRSIAISTIRSFVFNEMVLPACSTSTKSMRNCCSAAQPWIFIRRANSSAMGRMRGPRRGLQPWERRASTKARGACD